MAAPNKPLSASTNPGGGVSRLPRAQRPTNPRLQIPRSSAADGRRWDCSRAIVRNTAAITSRLPMPPASPAGKTPGTALPIPCAINVPSPPLLSPSIAHEARWIAPKKPENKFLTHRGGWTCSPHPNCPMHPAFVRHSVLEPVRLGSVSAGIAWLFKFHQHFTKQSL